MNFRYFLEKYTFSSSDAEKQLYLTKMKLVTPYWVS